MATISAKVRATGELFQATAEISNGIQHDAQPPIQDDRHYKGYLFTNSRIRDTDEPIHFISLEYTQYAGSEFYGYKVLMVVRHE